MVKKISSYQTGIEGEEQAREYLIKKGYSIEEERYKTKFGEIDIIASKEDLIISVEVKKRLSIEDSYYSISIRQKKRIIRTFKEYLIKNDDKEKYKRFDVILIDKSNKLEHIEGAWEEE